MERLSSLPEARIAPYTYTLLAYADLRCVTFRLRKKPALVRNTYNSPFVLEILILTFQDVTTRGNYYPDKSMATAAVGQSTDLDIEKSDLIMFLESPIVPPRYESNKARPRASRSKNRRTNEAGAP